MYFYCNMFKMAKSTHKSVIGHGQNIQSDRVSQCLNLPKLEAHLQVPNFPKLGWVCIRYRYGGWVAHAAPADSVSAYHQPQFL